MLGLALGVLASGDGTADPFFRAPSAGEEAVLRIEAVSDVALSELRGRAQTAKPLPAAPSKRRVILWDEALRPPDPAPRFPAGATGGNEVSIRRSY